jgi:hypothetical protein
MVTLLQSGILEAILPIFSLLFVMAVVFGILSVTKLFGDSKGLHILIAFILGIMVLLMPRVTALISVMMPWFTFFFIFIIFLLITYKLFGATDADIAGVLKADRTIGWIVLIICLVIGAGAAAKVYGQTLLDEGIGEQVEIIAPDGTTLEVTQGTGTTVKGSYSENLSAAIFHPKILGFGLLMLIAVLAMAVMAMEPR